MTAGVREWLCCIGVKGHAGMSPHQNFGRGGGKLKRVPIKTKTTPPRDMEKKRSRKTFKR